METLENYLRGIDEGLLSFKEEFKKFAVNSDVTLKYLRPYEVEEMNIPTVYKRMLMERIINLQTPNTKSKLKESVRDLGFHKEPKRLKFGNSVRVGVNDDTDEAEKSTEVVTQVVPNANFLENERKRLNEERDNVSVLLVHKKDELNDLKRKPCVQPAVGIPGNPITKSSCDNCHRKGHRAVMNRGNKACPYLPCEGFNVCGLDTKHPEHRQAVSEVTKDLNNLERRLRNINDELNSMKMFQLHNSSNFISVIRPVLKSYFPRKYQGKDGAQNLQRDLRHLKIACDGKIPDDQSHDNIIMLLHKGKLKVTNTVGDFNNNADVDNKVPSTASANACISKVSASPRKSNTAPSFGNAAYCQPVQYSVQSPVQLTPQGTGYTASMPLTAPYQYVMYPWMYDMYGNSTHRFDATCNNATTPRREPTWTVTCPAPEASPPLPLDLPPENPPLPDGDM